MDWNIERNNYIGGGEPFYLDYVYDENIKIHNDLKKVTNKIDMINKKIDDKQKIFDTLLEQYTLITNYYNCVSVINPFIIQCDDINIYSKIQKLTKDINDIKHEINVLNNEKKQYDEKLNLIEKNLNQIDFLLHKEIPRIENIIKWKPYNFFIQEAGNNIIHSGIDYNKKYLKYKIKYLQLKKQYYAFR